MSAHSQYLVVYHASHVCPNKTPMRRPNIRQVYLTQQQQKDVELLQSKVKCDVREGQISERI